MRISGAKSGGRKRKPKPNDKRGAIGGCNNEIRTRPVGVGCEYLSESNLVTTIHVQLQGEGEEEEDKKEQRKEGRGTQETLCLIIVYSSNLLIKRGRDTL